MKSRLLLLAATLALLEHLPAYATSWRFEYSLPAGSNLVNICLSKDSSQSGFFSSGNWVTSLGKSGGSCKERLIADLDRGSIHPDFDVSADWPRTMKEGRSHFGCLSAQTISSLGYSPCVSAFYSSSPDPKDRNRYFSLDSFENVLRQAKTIEALDSVVSKMADLKTAQEARKTEAERERKYLAYTKEFESSKSLEAITAFEKQYRDNDPDNLIPKLEPLKLQLETKQYQDRFASAKSSSELQSFISDYESKDPDHLTPQAKKRLAVALKAEQAEQEKRKRDQSLEQKQGILLGMEDRITNCNRMTAQANRAIAREREIAAVSGYLNTSVMRQAGEYIVTCRSIIADSYAEYRKAGGTKSLSAMK